VSSAARDQVLVEARDVSKRFASQNEETAALAHVTFSVRHRDRTALVGPSGSGKSSLLHLLAGLDTPTTGTLDWPALGPPGGLRPGRVSLMTQSPSLIGWLTVAENVALPLQLLRRPNLTVAKLTETTLAQFDLDALAGKLPEQISGGEAQRVSLVRATITNPKLLLADEPTGQLDHATAQRLIDLLLTWTERTGAAVVLATHDRDVADRLDHVFTMSHGHMGNESGEGAL